MAFAYTNVRKGTAGDLKITAGDWTGSVGDASGTIAVEGGRVYSALFYTNNTTSPSNLPVPTTWPAASGSTTTITVHNRQTVATGTFIIHHA